MSIESVDSSRLVGAPRRPRRRHWSRWLRIAVLIGLAAVLIVDFPTVRTVTVAAVAGAWRASGGWLLFATALSIASMTAFGLVRQRTIRAAGGSLPLREAVAVSYAAGAIHLTTPAGIVPSTAYAFRRLQHRGIAPAAVTWSLTISGILSSVALVVVGLGGFTVERPASATGLLAPAFAATAAAIVVIGVVRHPAALEAVATRALRVVNRLTRRPADAGVLTVRVAARDLAAVRPAHADWLIGGAAALANWLLDLLCLWACAESLGIHLPPWMLFAGYALAMAGAGVSPLPGGVGVVDGIVVFALTAGGHVPASVAVAAVLLYRVISLGTLLIGGWGSVAAQAFRSRHRSAPNAVGDGAQVPPLR